MTDKRPAILAATLKLISEKGFHGTPISQIASEAGVSAGIIYHYFDSKEDLINVLFREMKMKFGRALVRGYDEQMPMREQFRLLWVNAIHHYIAHPAETRFMEQYKKSPFYTPEVLAEVSGYIAPLMQLAERAAHEQIIKPMPDEMLYTLTIEVASVLAEKHAAGLITMTDELIDLAVDACWDAVKR